ncbi:MAG TPA: serine protease, partial [Nocardioides sp.]|nr:serine protease [Nocardioides sp.]
MQPSIVYLQQDWSAYVFDKANKTYLNQGQPFELSFQCTGFVVNPDGYIATAGHCVDLEEVKPAFFETAAQWAVDNGYYLDPTLTTEQIVAFQDYRVETLDKVNRADLVIQVGWSAAASGIETAEVRRARVVGNQGADAGDVALLKVEASGLNALPLSEDDVDVGTEVVSIGYPASVDSVTDPDLAPSYKDGSISSVKTVQGGLLTVYEISAAVSGGMSGGPTVDLDGRVVGVNSFGIAGESQPFNFVRPSSQLAELMANAGVDNLLSETTTSYREGLEAYWNGDRATAVEALEAVVEEQPSNQIAADYLERAEDLPAPPPPEEGGSDLPVVPIIVAVAALGVVGIGTAAFLVLRRRRAPTTQPTTQPPAPAPAPPPAG